MRDHEGLAGYSERLGRGNIVKERMMFSNIQVLQAAAAYSVVGLHLVDSWNNYTGAHFGYSIDFPGGFNGLFFVISGFVNAEATRNRATKPLEFIRKRLVRIIPLYWALSVAIFITTLFGLKTLGIETPDLRRLILSLFFLPTFENGVLVSPTLFVGWTLNFQVPFYLLFGLALSFERYVCKEITLSACITVLYILSMIIKRPELGYYLDELLLGFVLGLLISRLHCGCPSFLERIRLEIFVTCLAIGSVFLVGTALISTGVLLQHQHAFIAIAGAMMVFGAVGLEAKGMVMRRKVVLLQGAASYSIFLVHPLILQFAGKAMILTGLNVTIPGTLIGYGVTLALVSITGTAIHLYIERPVSEALRPKPSSAPLSKFSGLRRRA